MTTEQTPEAAAELALAPTIAPPADEATAPTPEVPIYTEAQLAAECERFGAVCAQRAAMAAYADAAAQNAVCLSRALLCLLDPAPMLVLAHGIFQGLKARAREQPENAVFAEIADAVIAAVPTVPYDSATMGNHREVGAEIVKHALVVLTDDGPNPTANIAQRNAVASMLVAVLARRADTTHDADVAARLAYIDDATAAHAAAMHDALLAHANRPQA